MNMNETESMSKTKVKKKKRKADKKNEIKKERRFGKNEIEICNVSNDKTHLVKFSLVETCKKNLSKSKIKFLLQV